MYPDCLLMGVDVRNKSVVWHASKQGGSQRRIVWQRQNLAGIGNLVIASTGNQELFLGVVQFQFDNGTNLDRFSRRIGDPGSGIDQPVTVVNQVVHLPG